MKKEIVWEYVSPFIAQGPHHMGKRVHKGTRYSSEYVKPLFDSRNDVIIGEVTPDGMPIGGFRELLNCYRCLDYE